MRIDVEKEDFTEIKFDPDFVEAIRSREKTSTIRLWDDYRVLPGDPFTAKTDAGDIISNETCEDVEDRPLQHIIDHGVEGHQDYESVDELIEELEGYYPDKTITPETAAQVVYW